MDYLKVSAVDHIDLGYLPKDLWQSDVPSSLKDPPHVEDKDGEELWFCDGEV